MMIIPFIAGICVILSSSINAHLADLTDSENTVAVHYLTGLVLSLLIWGISGFSLETGIRVPSYLFFAGGFLGIIAVLGNNFLIRRLPVLMFSLVLYAGQMVSGLVIDYLGGIRLEPKQIVGLVLIAAGLVADVLLKRRGRPGEDPSRSR